MSGLATLEELETTWSLDDLNRASAMLDAKDYVERKALQVKKK